ncbi:hypothetical protein D3C71_1403760 [compost metagenome]
MKLSDLKMFQTIITASPNEEIHILDEHEGTYFFTKTRIKTEDFKGNKIEDIENEFQITSIWSVNITDGQICEITPYGDFDINDVYITANYLYFVKITDTDHDGLLLEEDYQGGGLWRVHRQTLEQTFCFNIRPYNFHRFLTANDNYVVFVSEDRIPDVTEVVFYDLKTKRFAVLNNVYDYDWCDFRLVDDKKGEPAFLFQKKYSEGLTQDVPCVNLVTWPDLIAQLDWE